jgi:hypothetical protein
MRIDTLFFVFNRPVHTFSVIKSILDQTKYPESIYIYFDMPEKEEDVVSQNEIKEYFQVANLRNAFYQEQTENKGIKRSITEAIENHFVDGADAVIVIEDDIEMHQSFIEYMYTALQEYDTVDHVNTVCGYRYPVLDFMRNKDETLYGMLIQRFNPWGWGTWKNKWKFEPFIDLKEKTYKTSGLVPEYLYPYFEMKEFIDGTADIWSINVVLRQYLTNTYSIYPSKQLVNNIGFDSTGVHSSTTKAFTDVVDWDVKYVPKLNLLSHSAAYETILNDFLKVHLKEVMYKNSKEEIK